jgi:small subunit ribosomal protein S3Ae
MGVQRVKEEPEAGIKEVKSPKERGVKKWKGKDWFIVMSPAMFGRREIGEIPATDSQSLIGRDIEVSLGELVNNPAKYYIKVRFKIRKVEGSRALTEFDGFKLVKDQVFRIVRKRTSKVEIVSDVETKDKWLLHFKIFAILNRTADSPVRKKVRLQAMDFLRNFASKAGVDDVIKTACEGLIQKNIKKYGSKIYPVRFCEIIKIDVKKQGGKTKV